MSNRLGIFACYLGESGVVEDYISYLLDDMRKNVDFLVVICNGKLDYTGRLKLQALSDIVTARDNKGFDAAAWQFAMKELLGWERVQAYDELVLFNDTFFGPVYPFATVFEQMEHVGVDFWGLTCSYEGEDPYGCSPLGYSPTHIQTYFLVINKDMLRSYEFRYYWDNLPVYETFEEIVSKHEIMFTMYFEDKGFSWNVYVDASNRETEDRSCNYNLYIYEPNWLMEEKRLPILKKKTFSLPLSSYLRNSCGNEMYQCMEYIDKHTDYDINLIWDYVLKNYNITDIFDILGLRYVLPVDSDKTVSDNILAKTLVIMHIHYEDQLEFVKRYVGIIPSQIHVLITVSNLKIKDSLENYFGETFQVEIIEKENRGRDLSSLLVVARRRLADYEYVCFVHDKNTAGIPRVSSLDFQSMIWENLLGSSSYILNVLSLFINNPRLGLVGIPAPSHGIYGDGIGERWAGNYKNAAELAARLHIKVPMSEDKEPILSGTAFWCRKEALQLLWNYQWSYEDFPEEPLAINGQISHALERLFPYVAQQAGYYTAIIQTPRQAAIEARNSHHMLEKIVRDIKTNVRDFPGFNINIPQASSAPMSNFYDHYFPYHLFHGGTRVVIYGAGNIGKQFYKQAIHDGYVDVVGIVDKNAENIHDPEIPVQSINVLKHIDCDYVLISMNHPVVAESGKQDIISMGVPLKKIKWDGPVYYRDHFYKNFYYRLMDKFNPEKMTYHEILDS